MSINLLLKHTKFANWRFEFFIGENNELNGVQKCSDFFLSFLLIVKMGVSCSSNTWLFFWACVIFSFTHIISRDDNVAGRVRRIWSLLLPRMVLSYPIFVSPHMTRKIFLPHSWPLGPCKASPHPIKLYFVLICP